MHIFEDRYKEMIGDCLDANHEFGVVLAGEKGMASIGCTAVVERILKKYPDGRMDILARGRGRFEIILLDEEKNYLRAAISPISDEEEAAADEAVRHRALSAYVNLMMMEHGGLVDEVPDSGRSDLSFVLAQPVADVEFRQKLLMMRSERERLEALASYLPMHLEREKLVRHVRRVAPLNGHSRHAADLAEEQ